MINQEISQQLFTVWKSHHAELKKHISQIYSGHIILFQASEKLPNDLDVLLNMNTDKEFVVEGWNNVASKPIERILVPGNHFTLMDEPNIRILSEFLKVIIKRWEPDKIPNQSSSS